jgi:tRNA(fMet)-specific endonuclease VapC
VIQRYMMDTNTVSYIVKEESPVARAKLAGLQADEIGCLSIITEAELRCGLAKSPNAYALRSAIEGFFAKIQILHWGREEALAYGSLRAKQEAAGKILGNLDMLIAAHAIAVGAVLVTNDKAFAQVAGLPGAVNWATDL